MFESVGVPKDIVLDAVATYKEHYRVISTAKTTLLPKAKEAVKLAKEFASLGVVTTKTAYYSKVLMQHFELMHYFDVLVGREDVFNPKPHKEPILKALESFDTKDQEIWMIGDTKLDILSAKAANINHIGVLSGYDTKYNLMQYTNNIFSDTYEAIKFLQGRL